MNKTRNIWFYGRNTSTNAPTRRPSTVIWTRKTHRDHQLSSTGVTPARDQLDPKAMCHKSKIIHPIEIRYLLRRHINRHPALHPIRITDCASMSSNSLWMLLTMQRQRIPLLVLKNRSNPSPNVRRKICRRHQIMKPLMPLTMLNRIMWETCSPM